MARIQGITRLNRMALGIPNFNTPAHRVIAAATPVAPSVTVADTERWVMVVMEGTAFVQIAAADLVVLARASARVGTAFVATARLGAVTQTTLMETS